MSNSNEKIANMTGVALAAVDRILQAQLDLLLALGVAHGDEDDARRGETLQKRYPDLLRPSVVQTAGRTSTTPVTFELEATIVQLESGASAQAVTVVLAAANEPHVGADHTRAYRAWAAKWVTNA